MKAVNWIFKILLNFLKTYLPFLRSWLIERRLNPFETVGGLVDYV